MTLRNIYSPTRSARIATSARPVTVEKVHVISSTGGKWSVVGDGSIKAIKSFASKQSAVNFAKRMKSSSIKSIIIHDRYGAVDSIISVA